jgi:hypothetical protein
MYRVVMKDKSVGTFVVTYYFDVLTNFDSN